MAAAMQGRVMKEVIKSYSYVLLWMSISISVILFNKWLLAFSGFPYPITLTMWHMIFCSTVGFLCVRVGKLVKPHNMSAHDYLRRVMPIGRLTSSWPLPANFLRVLACETFDLGASTEHLRQSALLEHSSELLDWPTCLDA